MDDSIARNWFIDYPPPSQWGIMQKEDRERLRKHADQRERELTQKEELVYLSYCKQNHISPHPYKPRSNEEIKRRPPTKRRAKRAIPIPKEDRAEFDKLQINLKRAIDSNLPATLTLEEWKQTLAFFGWKCAYCQKSRYVVLEHFISISLGGGTTINNCVPSCRRCNNLKKGKLPAYVRSIPSHDIERVQLYLDNQL